MSPCSAVQPRFVRSAFRRWSGMLRVSMAALMLVLLCNMLTLAADVAEQGRSGLSLIRQIEQFLAQYINYRKQHQLSAEVSRRFEALLTQFDKEHPAYGRIGGDAPFELVSGYPLWSGDGMEAVCVSFMPPLSSAQHTSPELTDFQIKNAILVQAEDGWQIAHLTGILRSVFEAFGCPNWLDEGDISDVE